MAATFLFVGRCSCYKYSVVGALRETAVESSLFRRSQDRFRQCCPRAFRALSSLADGPIRRRRKFLVKQDFETPSAKIRVAAMPQVDAAKIVSDIWFDKLAFQPAQAIFGIASGKNTGRGFGLGYPEVIPIADSDYIYAAIAEEEGLVGGAIIILATIIFVVAGVRTSLDARDMFTKLCAAGLTAFMGFQALVNT